MHGNVLNFSFMFLKVNAVTYLKWVLGLVIMVYLFYVLKEHLVHELSWSDIPPLSSLNWRALILVVCIMPLNWSLEALKWQLIMRRTGKWSFPASIRCTLAGASTAIVTPNRLGDVAGRVALVTDRYRKDALLTAI
jgi:hypothetical protein